MMHIVNDFSVWLRTGSNPEDNNRFQIHTGKMFCRFDASSMIHMSIVKGQSTMNFSYLLDSGSVFTLHRQTHDQTDRHGFQIRNIRIVKFDRFVVDK